jgi:hypothetical protein
MWKAYLAPEIDKTPNRLQVSPLLKAQLEERHVTHFHDVTSGDARHSQSGWTRECRTWHQSERSQRASRVKFQALIHSKALPHTTGGYLYICRADRGKCEFEANAVGKHGATQRHDMCQVRLLQKAVLYLRNRAVTSLYQPFQWYFTLRHFSQYYIVRSCKHCLQ